MNKKLLVLFTFLLILTSVSQTAFAIVAPTPATRMMSPEAFCSLDAVKLARGSKGESVVKFQRTLEFIMNLGMHDYKDDYSKSIALDGKFGKTTEYYTKYFQRDFGLTSDGVVGRRTREKMTSLCIEKYSELHNIGTIGSDNPYVKKVSLGDEFTVKPGSSFVINDTAIVVSVSQIYGNKCSANAAFGPDVVCTMEYNPAIRFTGMFGGDVSMGFTPQTLYVGETSNFSLASFADRTDATLKLVSVSDDGTSVKLKIEKK